MELNMEKALYERVIIEIIKDDTPKKSLIKGMGSEDTIVKVKVLDWGTDVKGDAFGWPVGSIAYMQSGANLTKVGTDKYLCDRRLILGTE